MHIHLERSYIPEEKKTLGKESLKSQHPVAFVLMAVKLLMSHSSLENGGEHLDD